MAPLREQLDAGLRRVELLPAGHGFVDVGVGVDSGLGAVGYAEAGYRLAASLALYGSAQAAQRWGGSPSYGAQVGLRGEF